MKFLILALVPLLSQGAPTQDQWFPKYHLSPKTGWMNDPNGLIYYEGYYHAFYQHNPDHPFWSLMHWGHARSKDMVTWEHLPIALTPSLPEDIDGIFSGSAVNNNGTLTLMYTGVSGNNTHQAQCLATSNDGVTFDKKGAVLKKGGNDEHFRDPKVWKQGDSWYVVVGTKDVSQSHGIVLLYKSKNLYDWEYQEILAQADGELSHLGYMWECPDFFTLNGKHLLVINPQGVKQDGYNYANLYQTGYFVGSWEPGKSFEIEKNFREIDFGHDFYAAQTFLAPDGRRILIGWMDMWESPFPENATGWAGMFTLPRELSLSNSGDLQVSPVKEVENLRSGELSKKDFFVKNNSYLNVEKYVTSKEVSIKFNMKNSTAEKFGVKLGDDQNTVEGLSLYVNRSLGRLFLERNYPGQGFASSNRSVVVDLSSDLSLRIFFDSSSIEVFVNRTVLSSRIYPKETQRYLSVFAENGAAVVSRYKSWNLDN